MPSADSQPAPKFSAIELETLALSPASAAWDVPNTQPTRDTTTRSPTAPSGRQSLVDMQGLAAHDAIEEAEHRGAAARLSSSPKAAARLEARPREPEAHGPSLIERELGEGLHPERNAQHGHPGVDCHSLPASHAHR